MVDIDIPREESDKIAKEKDAYLVSLMGGKIPNLYYLSLTEEVKKKVKSSDEYAYQVRFNSNYKGFTRVEDE